MRCAGLFAVAVLSILLALSSGQVRASPDIIYSDSQDGWATTHGGGAANSYGWAYIGDNVFNDINRAFFKFSLTGIPGTLCVVSARLYLYIIGGYGDSAPYQTPVGLGDCVVRHIDDYGTLDYSNDFNAPSIDNDPGTLIPDLAPYSRRYVSIDVTSAMQDDISNGRAFTSFMVRHSIDTDNDRKQDGWQFQTSEAEPANPYPPYIDYALGPCPEAPVGGLVTPANTFAVLGPWLAVIGLVGCISTVVVVAKKRR